MRFKYDLILLIELGSNLTVHLHHSVGLAPMEGVTDFATRVWFAKVSAPAFCWTPFYRATYTSNSNLPELYAPEIFSLRSYIPYFLIPQIMTGSIDDFCRVAEHILKYSPFVDLNCGCPSSKVVGRGSGSSSLETAEKFHNLVSGIAQRIGSQSLTVKMRLGFNGPEELPLLIDAISAVKLRRVTIHGRTRPQRYTGVADWNAICVAAQKNYFPVAGSGDIFSVDILNSRKTLHSFDAYPIGRGALRNPWIFCEIRSQKQQTMNVELLIYALASFALLQDIQKKHPERLFEMAKQGIFQCQVNHDSASWKEFYSSMTSHSLASLDLSGFAFARLKMLWNSLRTSLPEAFFSPEPLRARNLSDWEQAVRRLANDAPSSWSVLHQSRYDWLLSGQKSSAQDAQAAFLS